jgi:hypothetical protein
MIKPDGTIDDRLEPAEDAARRARLRNEVRILRRSVREEGIVDLANQLQLHRVDIVRALSLSHFGVVFAELEFNSSCLAKRKVPLLDLDYQIQRARSILIAYTRSRQIIMVPSQSQAIGDPQSFNEKETILL